MSHEPYRLVGAPKSLELETAVFNKIFESGPDAIVITNQEGRIVRFNTEAGKLFGYGPHEILGQMMEVLVPERLRSDDGAHRESDPGGIVYDHLEPCRSCMGGARMEASSQRTPC